VTTLRQGDTGDAVRRLQWLLRATGHEPGPLDGIFGPKTRLACDAFGDRQGAPRLAGWRNDAHVDDVFLDALRAAPRVGVEMPRVRTPVAWPELAHELTFAFVETFGHKDYAPGTELRNAVRVAGAMLAVEHWDTERANFGAIWCNNVGNHQIRAEDRTGPSIRVSTETSTIRFNHAPTSPFFVLASKEILGGREATVPALYPAWPPGPSGLAEGCAAFWRTLRDHYGHALPAFGAGDPEAAARLLKGLADIGGPFKVGDMVALARGDENLRGHVRQVLDGDEYLVQWGGGAHVELHGSVLCHAHAPYYTGSLRDYARGMRDRFAALA